MDWPVLFVDSPWEWREIQRGQEEQAVEGPVEPGGTLQVLSACRTVACRGHGEGDLGWKSAGRRHRGPGEEGFE